MKNKLGEEITRDVIVWKQEMYGNTKDDGNAETNQ